MGHFLLRSLSTDEFWRLLERASWLATLAGLVTVIVGVFQIRQLARHPSVKAGFLQDPDPGGEQVRLGRVATSMTIAVHWRDGSELSEPVEITVVVVNDANATATAYDIGFEVRYPGWLHPQESDVIKLPWADIWSVTKPGLEPLNPGLTAYVKKTFRIPRGRGRIPLHAIVSLRDAPMVDQRLTVEVEGQLPRSPSKSR
jgi:hypothetical protein